MKNASDRVTFTPRLEILRKTFYCCNKIRVFLRNTLQSSNILRENDTVFSKLPGDVVHCAFRPCHTTLSTSPSPAPHYRFGIFLEKPSSRATGARFRTRKRERRAHGGDKEHLRPAGGRRFRRHRRRRGGRSRSRTGLPPSSCFCLFLPWLQVTWTRFATMPELGLTSALFPGS